MKLPLANHALFVLFAKLFWLLYKGTCCWWLKTRLLLNIVYSGIKMFSRVSSIKSPLKILIPHAVVLCLAIAGMNANNLICNSVNWVTIWLQSIIDAWLCFILATWYLINTLTTLYSLTVHILTKARCHHVSEGLATQINAQTIMVIANSRHMIYIIFRSHGILHYLYIVSPYFMI